MPRRNLPSIAYDTRVAGAIPSRLRVEEFFTGDVEASNVVEFRLSGTVDGSVSFVGFGPVEGAFGDKRGTFLLCEAKTINGDAVFGKWYAVLGSGMGKSERAVEARRDALASPGEKPPVPRQPENRTLPESDALLELFVICKAVLEVEALSTAENSVIENPSCSTSHWMPIHSATRAAGGSAKSRKTTMNTRMLLMSRYLGVLIFGIIAFVTPVAVMATGAHVIAAAITAARVPVHAPDTNDQVDETALTSRAVIAVDDHWSIAELYGRTAWLRSLLLPGYRSVRADGSVWDKKTLLAHAAQNRGHGPEKLKAFDAWLKNHPMNESVIIRGNVSILSFSDPETGRVRLSNVFVHENGRWHALYSQLAKTE